MTMPAHPTAYSCKERVNHLGEVGALPWRIGDDKRLQVLLIAPHKGRHWTLPSGMPAKERTADRSAALRAFEQVGIIGEIDPVAVGRYGYAKQQAPGETWHCQVTVFGLRVKGTLVSWRERKRLSRRWFDIGEAAGAVGEPELARLLQDFDPQACNRVERDLLLRRHTRNAAHFC